MPEHRERRGRDEGAPPPPDTAPPLTARADGSLGALSSTLRPPVTQLDEALVLAERVFLDRLEERARRATLLTALLRASGLSRDQGIRAVQAALGALALGAEDAQVRSLAALAHALESSVGEFVESRTPSQRVWDVLVLDEFEVSRDLVALAVEAQGHVVRCAATYEDFVRQLHERLPDLVITEIELENAPRRQFVTVLYELLTPKNVPFVFFSDAPENELRELASTSQAKAAISKDRGIAGLTTELERILC
jgi:CheY-like chemotaxis protein